MAKLGREKARMTAFHKRQGKAAQTKLRKLGKSMSRSARSAWKETKPQKRKSNRTRSNSALERRPSVPLSPKALKVRLIAIVVAVFGGLLSTVLVPVGSPLCIAGVAAAIMARRVAGWIYGDDASDSE